MKRVRLLRRGGFWSVGARESSSDILQASVSSLRSSEETLMMQMVVFENSTESTTPPSPAFFDSLLSETVVGIERGMSAV
jgi:hypothetical protein